MLKGGGGGHKSFEVVLTWELELLAILMGEHKKFPSFKGGGRKKVLPCREWGSQKV